MVLPSHISLFKSAITLIFTISGLGVGEYILIYPSSIETWYSSRILFCKSSYYRNVAPSNHISENTKRSDWTFLTNHGHVLVCIASDPGIRGKDIAAQVGITERAAQAIVADLVENGYLTRTKIGRRNHYEINPNQLLRHPVEQPHLIGELLKLATNLGPSQRLHESSLE